jgi:hypothetical protein
MDPSQAVQDFKASLSKAADAQSATTFPQSYWITLTNADPGQTWISLPQSGNLWIFYEWSNAPAESIYVWHQGGATTPINPGQNTIAVNEYDIIIYTLTNPGSDLIKLGYQYV